MGAGGTIELPDCPAVDDVETRQDADDDPPRLAGWRRIFCRDVILAIRTSRHVFGNWLIAVRARNGRLIVRVVVARILPIVVIVGLPFVGISDGAGHVDGS